MQKYRIMIVDDEADVREGIVTCIPWDSIGFEVVAEAENGQDALEKVESTDIDVILSDIRMPFMDGLTMCGILSQTHPGVKVIILSGYDEFAYAKEAIRLNVIEYVLKPVNAAELTDILQKVKRSLDEGIAQKRDMDVLRESYREYLPLMQEHFLTELLWGAISDAEIEAQCSRYNLAIEKNPYRVVTVFEVDKAPKNNTVIAWELIPVSIRDMITEQLEGRCHSNVFVGSSFIIAITAWNTMNPFSELMSVVNEICVNCMRVLEVRVTVGIGRCYARMRDIHDSFFEARDALNYKDIAGKGKAIYIHDMEQMEQAETLFESGGEEQLFNTLKFGSAEQIEHFVWDIFTRLENEEQWVEQANIISLFSAVYTMLQRHGLQQEPGLQQHVRRFIQNPAQWKNKTWAWEWMRQVCTDISEFISTRRETAARNLVQEALRFIEANYQQSDLSVERLCEHVHVSQSYFSSIFKQETGTSYVQYVTELRLKKAMHLLQQTDDKTYEIARKVGYEEPNYFSYVFKKRFGISPTKYRK